jgi:hypothetical protein
MVRLCSLCVVRKGDWLFKASSFDDQILIFGFNDKTVASFTKMFYDEETAYFFMEEIYDKHCKVGNR